MSHEPSVHIIPFLVLQLCLVSIVVEYFAYNTLRIRMLSILAFFKIFRIRILQIKYVKYLEYVSKNTLNT